jgi:hypothetical protein
MSLFSDFEYKFNDDRKFGECEENRGTENIGIAEDSYKEFTDKDVNEVKFEIYTNGPLLAFMNSKIVINT